MTSEERLTHDIEAAIDREVADFVKYDQPEKALSLIKMRDDVAKRILRELRIRWTIVERPRKQTTHRQEA